MNEDAELNAKVTILNIVDFLLPQENVTTIDYTEYIWMGQGGNKPHQLAPHDSVWGLGRRIPHSVWGFIPNESTTSYDRRDQIWKTTAPHPCWHSPLSIPLSFTPPPTNWFKHCPSHYHSTLPKSTAIPGYPFHDQLILHPSQIQSSPQTWTSAHYIHTRGSVPGSGFPGSRVILTGVFIPGFLSNPGKSREIIWHCLCIIFNYKALY